MTPHLVAAISAGDIPAVFAPGALSCNAEISRWPNDLTRSSTHSARSVLLTRRVNAQKKRTIAAAIHRTTWPPSRSMAGRINIAS